MQTKNTVYTHEESRKVLFPLGILMSWRTEHPGQPAVLRCAKV